MLRIDEAKWAMPRRVLVGREPQSGGVAPKPVVTEKNRKWDSKLVGRKPIPVVGISTPVGKEPTVVVARSGS